MTILFLLLALFCIFGSIAFSCLAKSQFHVDLLPSQKLISKLLLSLQRKLTTSNDYEEIERLYLLHQFLCLLTYMVCVSCLIILWSHAFLWLFMAVTLPLTLHLLADIYITRFPSMAIQISSVIASIFVIIFFPCSYLFFRIVKKYARIDKKTMEAKKLQRKILGMLRDPKLMSQTELHDYKLMSSVTYFRDRIAREIMVPRIQVSFLPSTLTINKAATMFVEEEYSRVPIYKDELDNIIGVLLFKDLFRFYIQAINNQKEDLLEKPISTLIKPVLYTPETQKISKLLQEFRMHHSHLAIVVDEYGGTEGIVTIEDILEELVGEIADEYDQETSELRKEPSGAWVVNATMRIVDLEKELKIHIPKSQEYDTIGGYVCHKTGIIPLSGFCMHHDNFDLVVIHSNEKGIEQLRIIPL